MINYSLHEKYMQRCIQLAELGKGNTAPNPMVGAVIVYNNKIIGEGYHRKYGEAHAEVNAINSVVNKNLLQKSTIYVSLEPCSHFGKTPPCANLIVDLDIPNVVIGAIDTASHVSGQGIKILKSANINVTVGVLEKECKMLNKRFFTFHEKKRPYIILKWAQTKDGFIDIIRSANNAKQPTWITNEYSKTLVHKWRAEEQAILIGTNTAKKDNPSLTTRNWFGKNPLRIVLDRELKLDPKLSIFNDDAETLIITDILNKKCRKKIYSKNSSIVFVDYKKDFYTQLFKALNKKSILSIIIEGGEQVLNSFIKNEYWDEARIFEGNKEFKNGIHAPKLNCLVTLNEQLGNSKLGFVKK
jgi:diaminohydroxyphosphoribosylaminopyrimidine deaminase/5-amino-6-(5-phosphoribosylamino)uracil reductase